jgi:hypothetical protein
MLNTNQSFLQRVRQRIFERRVEREICDRILAHIQDGKMLVYPFRTRQEMVELTKALDVQAMLDAIECRIRRMPEAYAQSLRYLLHRDLHEVLNRYKDIGQRDLSPTHLDPCFVAKHA